MAGEIPEIRVIIDNTGDAVNVDRVQSPLQVTHPLIIKTPTIDPVQAIPVDGDATPLDHLAATRYGETAIAKFRAVYQLPNGKIAHINPTLEPHRRGYLGITKNPAGVGKKATVVMQGLLSSQTWNWAPGPVHCTADGVLTQDINAQTFAVATALTPTQLMIGGAAGAGSNSGGSTFIYDAPSASTLWEIVHNLGRHPSVSVVDSAGEVILADVDYVNINTVHVKFAYATGGSAYLV